MKHTPEPWTARRTEVGWRIYIPFDGAYKGFVNVEGTSKVAEANARLIAAAPKLLEALKSVLDSAEIDATMSAFDNPWLAFDALQEIRDEARAAIAAAEDGEQE